ncbi:MAG: carbohydrate kinase family protein [Chitinophagaceae bacterium]|nr:carbohydrate kinase family protein [Chitinophagaceae bacterium]
MTTERTAIVCTGILCADILGKTINDLPAKGKLSLADEISMQVGGCAANVAIGMAKLGFPPAIIGRIGQDGLGNFIRGTLLDMHVNMEGLKMDGEYSTAASMVMIDASGERTIIHAMGANAAFCFNDIQLDIVKQAKLLLIAGTFLMPSFDGEGTQMLLRYANENGVICCMDTAWDATGEWLHKIEPALQYLDWFMPSYDEAVELSGKKIPSRIAQFFLERGVKNVVIKLGNEGCFVQEGDNRGYLVPSYKNVVAVDSSGAGDSFCAGFITGLNQGWPVRDCAVFANAVGAHCVMKIGTTAGITSMQEILDFIKSAAK